MEVSARALWIAALLLAGCGPPAKTGFSPLDLASFRQAFNTAADHTRILVLLSPT